MFFHRQRTLFISMFIFLSLFFIALLIYSNKIIKQIEASEKNRIVLWADAIQKRANLISATKIIFEQIEESETERARMLASSYEHIATMPPQADFSFYYQLINSNKNIPYILTDDEGNVTATRNLTDDYLERINTPELLQTTLLEENYEEIAINYLPGEYIHLYYKESITTTKLRALLNADIKNFSDNIIKYAPSIPVIVMDSTLTKVITYGNVDSNIINDSTALQHYLEKIKKRYDPFITHLDDKKVYIFYKESPLIRSTFLLPYTITAIIILFILLLLGITLYFKNVEQTQTWKGISKETAHQLGTPISSLMAWTEILKSENVRTDIVDEIDKDTQRLNDIAQRFSKIGSIPQMEKTNVAVHIHAFADYFKPRISSQVQFIVEDSKETVWALLNKNLFFWVLENISKNAVDAMEGKGTLHFRYGHENKRVYIDISDTGKGMSKQTMRKIFMPGFTTKSRGWGVGLSLCKRIVESYHHGKIKVKYSEIGKGTTFRILLPTCD